MARKLITDKQRRAKVKRLRKQLDSGEISMLQYFIQLSDFYNP